MAKKVLLDTYYTFTPETNTIVIPRVIQRENLMLVTNVTTNQVIYNFSDPDLNAISYTVKGSSIGSTTTIVLNYFCGDMLSTDKLQVIYDEYDEKITPSDNLVDAVAKMRVAAPQSLIDTDFEYGTQGNKWEALTLTHNYASFFSKGTGGNSFEVLDITSYAPGSNARVKSNIGVATASAHGLSTNDVVSVQETTNNNAEGTFAITVPSTLIFSVTTATDLLTSAAAHGLFEGQPIIFSGIGGAVGTANSVAFAADKVYYVNVQSATTIKLYDAPILATRFLVDLTTAGSGITTDISKMFSYSAKARVPSGSILDGTLTTIVGGGVFDNAHIPGGVDGSYDTFSVAADSGGTSNFTVSTTEPHGLLPGTPILINGVTTINSSAGDGVTNDFAKNLNGSWLVESTPTPNQLTLKRTISAAAPFSIGVVNSNALLLCKPESYIQHTSYNGGVQLSTVNNVTGIQQIRQTRKTFRYQSGKAIQFSTGAKFTPSYDIQSIKSDVQSGTATVIVTTVQDHGLQYGSRVKVEGIEVIGGDINPYNGDFLVKGVINQNTFTYSTTITPAFVYPTNINPSGENSVVTVSSWAGAATRAGLYNEMNGIFFEYDGQKLWACKRSSNKPLYGTIAANNKSNLIVGTDTRFTKQLIVGDNIVIKGQVYKVLYIDSDRELRVAPAYRGINVSASKFYKVQTTRVSQDNFNMDRLDGTGPSGYILDPTKMQMIYIDYTWYGSGFIRFGMRMINGDIMYCHKMPNNNINTQSYMRSGNLPARYEVNHYSPRTKLIAGIGDTQQTTASESDIPGKTLNSTDQVLYVQDITGWRTVSPSKSATEIIGYLLVEKNGASPQSEIMSYKAVGSYNTKVGGYPITVVRNQKQPLIIGSYDGPGTITTSTTSTTIIGTSTTFTSLNVGDLIYLSNGVKLGEVLSITSDTAVVLTAVPPVNPIIGNDNLPQGYTAEQYRVVQVSKLSSGDANNAQTFLPDSSVPGALYQALSGVTVSTATQSIFTVPAGTTLDSRAVAGTRVDITDANTTTLNMTIPYYIASPNVGSGTFKLNTDYTAAKAGTGLNFASATTTASLTIASTEQVSVRVITQTCAPSLSHWGSSVIMDGGYDEDRGVLFNARMKRSLTIPSNVSRPLVSIRISPSVDNGIGRNFGKREIVNTMQLILNQLEILGTGPFLIEGIFNPTALNHTGLSYPADWESFKVGSGSLAQLLFHDNTGTGTGTIASPTGTYSGGDTIFSFYTDNSGGSNLGTTRYDLDAVKELGTSILSGNGSTKTPGFPNGPDILTIVATNVGSSSAIVSARLSWSEAQA